MALAVGEQRQAVSESPLFVLDGPISQRGFCTPGPPAVLRVKWAAQHSLSSARWLIDLFTCASWLARPPPTGFLNAFDLDSLQNVWGILMHLLLFLLLFLELLWSCQTPYA